MSSQDRLENVLRDFHIMISKSEVCDTDRIIVSKNAMFDLIDRLNACIYEIMDEYEMTQQSRDRALREHKKEGDRIIWDASRQAEDIYAASVMYTQEALGRLNRVVDEANMTISHLYREFGDSMKQQQETIRENELELKSQLQLLSDTEKYMSLIEERNREIEREEAEKMGRRIVHASEKTPSIKPEIKINEEYFKKAGIPLDDYIDKEPEKEEEIDPLLDEGVIESSYRKVDRKPVKEADNKIDKENINKSIGRNRDKNIDRNVDRNISGNVDTPIDRNVDKTIDGNVDKTIDGAIDKNRDEYLVRNNEAKNDAEYLDKNIDGRLDKNDAEHLSKNNTEYLNKNSAEHLDKNVAGNLNQNNAESLDQNVAGNLNQNSVGNLNQNSAGNLNHNNAGQLNETIDYNTDKNINNNIDINTNGKIEERKRAGAAQAASSQAYPAQGLAGQSGQGYISQEYATLQSSGSDDYDMAAQEPLVFEMPQKIQIEDLGLDEDLSMEEEIQEKEKGKKEEELSFFDKLMGKKKNR